ALDYTVESCVNSVGVNVNTASRSLLEYVSGIGPSLARYIVDYRRENGDFTSREDLMKVNRMGSKAFQQCAGFLRIPGASNPLDNTSIHPESYPVVEAMANDLKCTTAQLIGNKKLIDRIQIANYLDKNVGVPTLELILAELEKPGRDPRGVVEAPVYDESIRSIRDLRPDMTVTGRINNITAFGAFVDLGIKENGLIHISQLSDGFVSSPRDVVKMDQVVTARVLEVDPDRGRIALTLKGVSAD
ncbi:MAG: helix-hairpin-helix domain-containing protein, partial [Muribaculaceae bacterium]|nr:helix-hairpin-helix domain-containing protein [Muribaculaceae bacterium]